MSKTHSGSGKIVEFLRKRDYELVRELGEGACGKTVLLWDPSINQHFVCKKYHPYSETVRQALFAGFVREVTLLHRLHHPNVVRVFNHYLYPESYTGYILMEYIEGKPIDEFLMQDPDRINDVFLQAVGGFAHLEQAGVLHRDIRPTNLMVRNDGVCKIIDLGFGKHVVTSADFDKSVSLSWWCAPPKEFSQQQYNHCTEVYFVGKLFEKIVSQTFCDFRYDEILSGMCCADPQGRTPNFATVATKIGTGRFAELYFSPEELSAYREFSSAVFRQLVHMDNGTRYIDDIDKVRIQLRNVYTSVMLEESVPDAAVVLNCLLNGGYRYKPKGLPVSCIREFLRLLTEAPSDKCRAIMANLHSKLNTVPRSDGMPSSNDIPF